MWFITTALAAVVFSPPAVADTTVPDTAPATTVPVTTAPDTTVPETAPPTVPPSATLEFVRVTGGDLGRPGDRYEWAAELTATAPPGSNIGLVVETSTGWMAVGADPGLDGAEGWVCTITPVPPGGWPVDAAFGMACDGYVGETGTLTGTARVSTVVSDTAANGAVLGVRISVGIAGTGGTMHAADSIVVEHIASSPGVPLLGVAEVAPPAQPASGPELAQVLPETGVGHRAALLSASAAAALLAGVGCLAAVRRPGRSLTG